MKMIELGRKTPSLQLLLKLVQQEDVVLIRAGQPVAKLEKFTAEDWEDWLFEQDPKVIQKANAARERFKRGEGMTLREVRTSLAIARRPRARGRSK